MTEGPVTATLCDVTVTYLYLNGYFVQEGPTGPGIEIFQVGTWTPDVAVGDRVDIPVTNVGNFHGTKEVDAHDAITVRSSGNPIDGLIQDLSAGTLPSEDLESEIVRVTNGTVTAIATLDVTVSYGTATGVTLRVDDSGPFCIGAIFDAVLIATEYDAVYRIQSFVTADFTRLDTTMCGGGGTPPVPGDLRLNEFLADPPAATAGDANCDGTRDGTEDEFVELVNVSDHTLDLAGVTVSDSTAVRHTFSPGATLDAGKTYVIFGGGTPSCTVWPSDVWAVTASGGSLSLNNGGDTLTVTSATAAVLQAYTYGSEGGRAVSLTLNPDLNDTDATPAGVAGFVAHSIADTADASLFSPGTHIDASPF